MLDVNADRGQGTGGGSAGWLQHSERKIIIIIIIIDFICNALYIKKNLKVLHSKSRLKAGPGTT